MRDSDGSEPGYHTPVVIISADSFNRSRIRTVTVASLTSNVDLQLAPGNVLIKKRKTGLRYDSVVNVSAVLTVDRDALDDPCGTLENEQMRAVDAGLRLALSL